MFIFTGWERSIVCHDLCSGNRFVAHPFLQHPIQSDVYFFSFIAFDLDFYVSISLCFFVLINSTISRDYNATLNLP